MTQTQQGITDAKDRAQLASIARLVAEEAAALVTAGYRARPKPLEKGRWDLVTEFDRASQDLLVARLGSLAPGIPIVAEEGSERTKDQPGLVWYVDPLDGTTNFVHGHPFWCVAVGLMDEGQPVVGAVVAPQLAITWLGYVDADVAPSSVGKKGEAMRNGGACAPSAVDKLEEAMLGTGFPPQRDKAPDNNFGSFLSVKRVAQSVRRCGSAGIDICFVADGTYDGYWERKLHVWDLVAPCAIAIAAGGKVSSLDGGPPDYHGGTVAVSNGLVHGALLSAVARGVPLTGTY